MSKETLNTLQAILNTVSNPAYLKYKGHIILKNDAFEQYNFSRFISKNDFENPEYEKKIKIINDNFDLVEITNHEILALNGSTKKLLQAMNLL
jgi:hypothetical protein